MIRTHFFPLARRRLGARDGAFHQFVERFADNVARLSGKLCTYKRLPLLAGLINWKTCRAGQFIVNGQLNHRSRSLEGTFFLLSFSPPLDCLS